MSFLDQLTSNSNLQDTFIEEMKMSNEKLPLVLYGATQVAINITDFLRKNELEVADYFVDDPYVDSPQNKIDGVLTFHDITNKYPKFIVIAASGIAIRLLKTKQEIITNDQVKQIVIWDNAPVHFTSPKLSKEYIIEHQTIFENFYKCLEDQQSKDSLLAICNTRLTADLSFLEKVYNEKEYFDPEILTLNEDEIVVDGGAYTGDTLKQFLEAVNSKYNKYYAFEPDTANNRALKKFVFSQELKNIECLQFGLYSKSDTLYFDDGNGLSSHIGKVGNTTIQVVKIDKICSDATFVKMDIEGAELEALQGAKKTILKNKPKLAICIYHTLDHLTSIFEYIKSLRDDYKFYVRQHSLLSSDEFVLYAI